MWGWSGTVGSFEHWQPVKPSAHGLFVRTLFRESVRQGDTSVCGAWKDAKADCFFLFWESQPQGVPGSSRSAASGRIFFFYKNRIE